MDPAEPGPGAADAAVGGTIGVDVVYCPAPDHIDQVRLQLPAGATLAQALQASGLPARHGLDLQTLEAGVWSKLRPLHTVLRDRDRVELYRPLQVDPKEARRQRYRSQRRSGARVVPPGESTG